MKPSEYPSDLGHEKLGPGRYAVWRRFTLAGELHGARLECNNPAYGWKVIREWEKAMRVCAANAKARAA